MKQRVQLAIVFVTLGLLTTPGAGAGGNSAAAPAVAELPILGELGCGPCMDAAVAGDRMFVVGRGRLHIADISDPKRPQLLGELPGLGNTRQIVVDDDVAYVSSREDGVFLIDVSDPAKPSLLSHYNSVELATGLALAGDVLFVAQRQYGVEQVDVSDPRNPRHLSTVRTGEAQSIAYHEGHLYVGVWAASEVVVVDMHDARAPRVVSRTPLDGYGDGVDVRDGVLYVATGHHSRAPHARETDPGFGHGHGLELFDLSEPAAPAFISRVKFPPLYEIGHDMWSVTVANGRAFVADTHNGVFVVDVRDSRRPSIVGRRRFPPPAERDRSAFIGGLALGPGVLYAAGGWTDLHVLGAPELAVPATADTGAPPRIEQAREVQNEHVVARYQPDGQVYGVALAGENGLAVAACGAAGLHVVRVREESIETLSATPTRDFATDVYVAGRTVYAAEGRGGLSIWEISGEGRLTRLGTYGPGQNVRYVVVPPPGKFALVEVGSGQLHIVDVAVPARARLKLKDSQLGLFYGHQLLDHLVEGRYAAAFWHVSGLHWYDLAADPPRYAGQHPAGRFGMSEGLALFRGQILATRNRGYVLFDHDERRPFAELPVHRLPGVALSGKPTIAGDVLYVADRVSGKVIIANLSNPDWPALVDSFDTPGNPGRIVATEHGYLVPNGYDGLLLCKSPPNSSNVRDSR